MERNKLNTMIEVKELALIVNQAVDNFIEKHAGYFSKSKTISLEESITERLKQKGYKLEIVPDGEKSALYTIVQAENFYEITCSPTGINYEFTCFD